MITIFNRREVSVTFDVHKLAKVREILTSNDIDYKIKIFSREAKSFALPNRIRMGNFGINVDYGREYVVYVRKDDLSKARALLS